MLRLDYKILAGIVSFGLEDCTDPDYPAVFVRVAAVRNWIRTVSGA